MCAMPMWAPDVTLTIEPLPRLLMCLIAGIEHATTPATFTASATCLSRWTGQRSCPRKIESGQHLGGVLADRERPGGATPGGSGPVRVSPDPVVGADLRIRNRVEHLVLPQPRVGEHVVAAEHTGRRDPRG